MSALALLAWPAWPVLLALVCALLLLVPDLRARAWAAAAATLLVVGPCAAALVRGGAPGLAVGPLVTALIVAVLAREERDPLQGECALKLLWVLGVPSRSRAWGSA